RAAPRAGIAASERQGAADRREHAHARAGPGANPRAGARPGRAAARAAARPAHRIAPGRRRAHAQRHGLPVRVVRRRDPPEDQGAVGRLRAGRPAAGGDLRDREERRAQARRRRQELRQPVLRPDGDPGRHRGQPVSGVVGGSGPITWNHPAAFRQSWTEFDAARAHAALRVRLTLRGERLEAEMRLYDLTSPEHRLIAAKKFEGPTAQPRRLAHKIADEVVLQFTGEPGVADTKLAYVQGPAGAKEIWISDYDGANPVAVTKNGSINLM